MLSVIGLSALSYNGYTFDGASHITAKVEMVRDEADRTTIYHRIVIRIQGIVSDPGGTDTDLYQMRALLGATGAPLQFAGAGFHAVNVNSNGGTRDVKWGPKPQIISWEPIGGSRAAEVVWECVTCIAPCPYGQINPVGLLAFNYGVDYSLDHAGMTTRTITGYLEIAQTRNGTAVPDTADAYRSMLTPAVPLRFAREQQTFRLSQDKSRLDFTFVDSERNSPNGYPNGVVRIDAKHRISWARRGGQACRLRNYINVELELAADQHPLRGWVIFQKIVERRFNQASGAYNKAVMIEELQIEEDLFGRSHSFSISYTVTTELQFILKNTGIWTPLNVGDWKKWALSLTAARDIRGFAGLRHFPNQDAIIDICSGVTNMPWDDKVTQPKLDPPPKYSVFRNENPPPESSWISYNPRLEISRVRPLVRQVILQEPSYPEPPYAEQGTDQLQMTEPSSVKDILQESGKASYYARLKGWAYRAGYPIPRPTLQQIGSAQAKEIACSFEPWIVGNFFGVAVHGARWEIDYYLETAPGSVLPFADLATGVTGNGVATPPTG